MAFVQTAFLAGLAALAVPVLIHLLFRRRARRIDLGTLRFLKVVVTRNTRRRRLKRLVLLGLRMACVAALVGLFARPFLFASATGGRDSLLVLLIDRSASMALRGDSSPLEEAVAKAAATVKGTRFRRVEVAGFDADVRPVPEGESIPTKPGYGATDYSRALAWAADRRASAADGEIVLISDLQRSGLDRAGDAVPPPELPVRVIDVGRPVTNDLAVIAARPRRTVVRPGEAVTLAVTVSNGGPFTAADVPTVVRFSSKDSKRTLRKRVSVPAGETAAIEFELPELSAGLWSGSVTIETRDDLAADDVRHFAVLAAAKDRVLIVGDPGTATSRPATFFLESALRLAAPGSEFADAPYAVTRPADGRLPADLSPFRAIVWADPGPLPAADGKRLKSFVAGGGGLLVFTGEHVTPDAARGWQDAGLSPGKIEGVVTASHRPARITDWDAAHPVFLPFADPQAGDLRSLAFESYTQIAPAKGTRVLARFGTDPAVTENSIGDGRVLWFASAADPEWGDWTRGGLFLPLVYQMLGRLTGATDGGPVREATAGAEDADGKPAPETPGVYERRGHALVVNLDPREADLDRCTPEEFAARFDLVTPDAAAAVTAGRETGRELRRDEFWPWLLVGAMGLLLAEGFLGNRTEA